MFMLGKERLGVMKSLRGAALCLLWMLICGAQSFAQKSNIVIGPDSGANAPEIHVGVATATYFPKSNQIAVQTPYLQLYGTIDDGLIMIPNFTSQGKKVVAPPAVEFEFISYARRKTFAVNRKLLIYVNKELVFSAIPQMSSSGKSLNGTVTEVMTQKIPYEQFLKLLNGQDVKLRLGAREIQLMADQLDMLHDLQKCITSGVSFP